MGLSIAPAQMRKPLISPSSRMISMTASVRTSRFDQKGIVIRNTQSVRCPGGLVAMK